MIVPTESKSIQLHLDPDPRLCAGAGGAGRYFADAAGLDSEVVTRLQSELVKVCAEVCKDLHANQGRLEVKVTWLADRIEITLRYPNPAKPLAVERSGVSTGSAAAEETAAGFDRVERESQDNFAVTRLTKYIRQAEVPV